VIFSNPPTSPFRKGGASESFSQGQAINYPLFFKEGQGEITDYLLFLKYKVKSLFLFVHGIGYTSLLPFYLRWQKKRIII
jgi:hypothetical protein